MSSLLDICKYEEGNFNADRVDSLRSLLKEGESPTLTVEDVANEIVEGYDGSTGLHILMETFPGGGKASPEEVSIALKMIDLLFEWGAGWALLDKRKLTPGCICKNRDLPVEIYEKFVAAGTRAELLLRKVVDSAEIEILEDEEVPELTSKDLGDLAEEEEESSKEDEEVEMSESATASAEETTEITETTKSTETTETTETTEIPSDTSHNQTSYLQAELNYEDGKLVTKHNRDGVMMDWETDIMKMGADTLFGCVPNGKEKTASVINIGFGMGIIDKFIQEKSPKLHIICEAHPDVLAKMREDGWYEKPNVQILEGRWQETLPDLLMKGEYFDGIYYDTFSEQYNDMLELFDLVVGLLKPEGTFSFFNGLGADRQVSYDVYRRVVELDLADYGLKTEFESFNVPENVWNEESNVWEGVKQSYWRCPIYYHPIVRFDQ